MNVTTNVEVKDEAFSFPGKDIGVLLIHGFTGSPSEMKPLGEYLAQKGFGVYGVRLMGHGTSHVDMKDTRWPNWYQSVLEAMEQLQNDYSQIYVVGLSMGGLLALKVGSEFAVDGIACINAPMRLADERMLKFLPLLKVFKPYHVKKNSSNFKNPYAYDKMPLNALDSMLSLIKDVKENVLAKITKPLLVVQSREDKTVNPESGPYIHKKVNSAEKKLVWLDKGGHVATLGPDKDRLFKEIEDFVGR